SQLIFPQLCTILISVPKRVEVTDGIKHRVVASLLIVRDLNTMAAGVTDVGTVTARPALLAGAVFENALFFRHLGKTLHLRTAAAGEADVGGSNDRVRKFGLMVISRAGAPGILHVGFV